MKFVVLTAEKEWEIISGSSNVELVRVFTFEEFLLVNDAAAYFNFMDDASEQNYSTITKPVFINSVVKTLAQLQKNENCIRFNGWEGFVDKPMWEIAGNSNEATATILKAIGKTFIAVNDIAGFVSARVIAMVINEAYYAIEDAVSTKAEIDIAMKLGTNYPFGPFEWAEKIGLQNVIKLLETMALENEKYTPALIMKLELNK